MPLPIVWFYEARNGQHGNTDQQGIRQMSRLKINSMIAAMYFTERSKEYT
jgi:hypothetical protein